MAFASEGWGKLGHSHEIQRSDGILPITASRFNFSSNIKIKLKCRPEIQFYFLRLQNELQR